MSLLRRLIDQRTASRIWQRDATVFAGGSPDAGVRTAIHTRLGWLDVPDGMAPETAALRTFAEELSADGVHSAHVLGMGGSSLCAEVLRETAPPGAGGATLSVLDTTDERAIDETAAGLVPATTLFVVASKSGTTIEATSLERYFGFLAAKRLGDAAGRQFAAITDPGTPLLTHARERGYRRTFVNPPDIGGRYSALSLFGLVPAVLLGVDLDALLAAARAMARRSTADAESNPGLALGAFMAEQANAGRDKLTILLPAALAPLGAWIEQLIAESTGKEKRGILPVVDEPIGEVDAYGSDRAFVLVEHDEGATDLTKLADRLAAAGHPVFRVRAEGLGAEFFRWEFATAVAGGALGINPFDEPNVKAAKEATRELLDGLRTTGALRVDPPLKPAAGLIGCLVREHRPPDTGHAAAAEYLAILDYLPADPARRAAVDAVRQRIRRERRIATTYGIGPRYLHSTGQYHKGGTNTGAFLLLTAPDATTTAVPGTDLSFSVLKQAQALGDFNALVRAERRVVHVHVEHPSSDIEAIIEHVVRTRIFGS